MFRTSLRALRRQPVLSTTIIATLAIGVGVATALFQYLEIFLHPRFAAPGAERVAEVFIGNAEDPRQSLSHIEFERLQHESSLADSAAMTAIGASLGGADGSRYAWGQFVSGSFFSFLGGRPAAGRLLGPDDDKAGAPGVVVLGHGVWQSDFGGDPGVIGRGVRVNGKLLTVVGVAERGFSGLGYAAGFFVPLAQADAVSGVARLASPDERFLRTFVRPSPAAGSAMAAALERARQALATVGRDLDASAPLEGGPRRAELIAATGFDPQSAADPMYHAARALTGAAILFLLLGSANVAGLLLARAAAREREWAVRKALGAAPRRLLAAIVAEISAPVVLGAVGSLLVASLVGRWLEQRLLAPIGGLGPGWAAPGLHPLTLDTRAFLFAFAAAFATALLALLPPLVRVLRDDPNRALRAGDPRAGGGLTSRRLLVAGELSLAVLLLVGGVLLARSLLAAANGSLGFNPENLELVTIHQPRTIGARPPAATWTALREEASRLPQVTSATLVHVAPNSGWARSTKAAATETPDALRDVRFNLVAPDYFSTLGVPMVAGRALDARDAPGAPAAIVVSRALAERFFPGQPAVGRHLRIAGPVRPGEAGPDFEIVGVAADAATTSAIEPHAETLYFAYGQRTHSRMTLVLRTAAPRSQIEPEVRQALARVAPEAAVIEIVSADEQLGRSLHPLRTNASLAVLLAVLALITATAGLLALQIFALSLRRREFGIRLALGAQGRQIARLVLLDSLRLGLIGALVGVIAALAGTRYLGSLLYNVGALDPITFAAVPIALLLVVLVAAWIPARRAMATDPAESLRAL